MEKVNNCAMSSVIHHFQKHSALRFLLTVFVVFLSLFSNPVRAHPGNVFNLIIKLINILPADFTLSEFGVANQFISPCNMSLTP
jgi:hypothetical protein